MFRSIWVNYIKAIYFIGLKVSLFTKEIEAIDYQNIDFISAYEIVGGNAGVSSHWSYDTLSFGYQNCFSGIVDFITEDILLD